MYPDRRPSSQASQRVGAGEVWGSRWLNGHETQTHSQNSDLPGFPSLLPQVLPLGLVVVPSSWLAGRETLLWTREGGQRKT